MPLYDDLTFLLDEASMVSKLNLHSLIHDLDDQHQVLRYRRYMQDIAHDFLLVDMAQGNISNMLDGMWGVDYPRLLQLLEKGEPVFVV